MNPFVDPDICLRWVTTIASIGVLISTLEFLAMKRQFQSRGLFDWEVLKTRRDITTGTGFVSACCRRNMFRQRKCETWRR